MVADGNFLYVLQGGLLFKVDKGAMKVVGATPLMPQGMDMAPAKAFGRGPGAGGPPPPEDKPKK